MTKFGCHPSHWDPELQVNTGRLVIDRYEPGSLLWSRSAACDDCAWSLVCKMNDEETAILVNTTWGSAVRIEGSVNCEKVILGSNLGRYHLDAYQCSLKEMMRGENSLYAYMACLIGFLAMFFLYDIYSNCMTGWWSAQRDHHIYYFGNIPVLRTSRRLLSISVFRGFCICLMAFSNSGGGSLWFFEHAPWDGITLADIVFPMFIFCVGLSSQIAIAQTTGYNRSRFLQRSIRLIAIGIFIVNSGKSAILNIIITASNRHWWAMVARAIDIWDAPLSLTALALPQLAYVYYINENICSDLRSLRLFGVLQRIALCQLIVFPFQAHQNVTQEELLKIRKTKCLPAADAENQDEYSRMGDDPEGEDHSEPIEIEHVLGDDSTEIQVLQKIESCVRYSFQTESPSVFYRYFGEWRFISAAYLVAWLTFISTFLLRYLTTFGCPGGYTGPGGLSNNGSYYNCTGGVVGWVDRTLLGAHIYDDPTCKAIYDCIAFDPEGLMSTAGSLLNLAAGVHAGQILRWYPRRCDQNWRLFFYGFLHVVLGVSLNSVIPINKNLWSLSFSLTTMGISYLIYLCCRFFLDHVTTHLKLRPLAFVGDNTLVVYVTQEIFTKKIPYDFYVGNSNFAHVLLSLWTVFLALCLGAYLHRNNIRFKI